MSGAEVAGLVLAVLPLIISGLEHYGEGVRLLGKFRSAAAAREFERLKDRLECEYEIFLNTLEILLRDSVDDQTLTALLSDVGGDDWRDPLIEECLQERLQRSYKVFHNGINGMVRSLQELKESLQIDSSGKGPFSNEKWSVKESLKRLKFGLKMKAYEELLDEVRRNNSQLDKLAAQSTILEPIRQSRRNKTVPDFDAARAQACSIFAALRYALSGACNIGHRASLSIKPARATALHGSQDDAFRIVLHHNASMGNFPKPSWSTAEAEIRFLHKGTDQDGDIVILQQEIQVRQTRSRNIVKYQQRIHELKDLCGSLQSLRTTSHSVCLGYVAADKTRHGIYKPKTPLLIESASTSFNLSTIISERPTYRLSEPDKRRLAFSLALGMLRFYETPWLNKQWGLRDIVLFQRANGLIADHPFISTEVSDRLDPAEAYFSKCVYIRDETTFALGILLIELCLEKPFRDLRGPDVLLADGSKSDASDFIIADRLVDEVYDRAGLRWGDAARRCIRCDFDQRTRTLSDASFQSAVYEKVVNVLKQDVEEI